MAFKDLPIQKKLLRFIFLICGVVLFTTCLTFFFYEFFSFKNRIIERITTIGKIISANSTAALAFDNKEDAKEMLTALKTETHVVSACLYDKNGKLFVYYLPKRNNKTFPAKPEPAGYNFTYTYLEIFLPVMQGNKFLGTLYIKSDLGAMYNRFKVYGIIAVLAILLSLQFAYLFSSSLKKNISKPILALADTAKVITEKGDFSVRANKLGNDELGKLTDAFNQLLEKIQMQNETLKEFNKNLEQKVIERTIDLTKAQESLSLSEEKYRKIIEEVGDVVYTTDSKGFLTYINPIAKQLTGYPENELIGKHYLEFVDPEWKVRVQEFYRRQLLKKIKETSFSFPIITKSGEKKWIEQIVTQERKDGEIIGHHAILRDITQRKSAEAEIKQKSEQLEITNLELKNSEQQIQAIFNSAPDAVIVINHESIIEKWNHKSEIIFGWTESEVLGKPIYEFIIPERYREKHKAGMKHYLSTGIGPVLNKEFEIEAENKNGYNFSVMLSISPVNIKDKILFIGFIRDITEKKRVEESLKMSEEKFNKAFQASPSGITITDFETGVYLDVNESFLKMIGYSREEIIGHTSLEINYLGKEVRNELREEVKQTGFIKNKEVEIRTKSGTLGTTLLSAEVVEINRIKCTLTIFYDISNLKTAQVELKNSENFLNTIVENIPNMLFVKDAEELRFIRFNKAGEELLGYTKTELIGKNDYDFFPKDEADFFTINDRKVLSSGELLHIDEEKIHTKFKGERILETKKIPINDSKGNPIYLLGISNDITEQKKVQAELNKKTKELERSNKELEQFAYIASHDLQEPLRMVNSYLQLIEKKYNDKLDQDGKDFIHFAVDGSNRMKTLILSLLEYSRVNRVKPFEDINLDELLKNVLTDLKTSISENKATVTVEPLPVIYGDKLLINQLFQNLISNAVKFKGERDPVIIISGKKTDHEFLFSVSDNGIGIEKENVQKLFVIFQRLNTKEQYPGTGIGLAICKKIVEKHGGKIWFESEFGKGTTFYFTIKEKEEMPIEQINGVNNNPIVQ